METAASNWLVGEQKLSISILRSLVKNESSARFNSTKIPLVQSMLIQWSSAARQETPDSIIDNYLIPARDALKSMPVEIKKIASIYHTFAVFCDEQYNNPSIIEAINRVEAFRCSKKKEIDELSTLTKKGTSQEMAIANHHLEKIKKLYVNDGSELDRLQISRQSFLENSASFYLQAAINSPTNTEDISSFVSLWLSNVSDKGLNKAIETYIRITPSFLFVPWVSQLSSRLGEKSSSFLHNLEAIVVRICEDHPYHSLFSIIGLRMVVGKQDDITKQRCASGNNIWRQLVKSGKNKELLANTEVFSTQCVALAHYKVESKDRKFFNFDKAPGRSWWIKTLPTLNFPPPTAHISVQHDCKYKPPTIVEFRREIGIASGLSAPKIVRCKATDGKYYTMLFKGGKDDLRQDSIMEQVFVELNTFFIKDSEARSRNLKIRSYKVIPLGPTGGIIEFVSNTCALIDYLQPAHKKYHPKDIDMIKAREAMKNAQSKPPIEKLAVYQDIINNIKPVLHMFFFEQFYNPEDWLKHRIKYTRSTAAISMLGYVLGIGDRHCNNILLDMKTGEVVHIDLGIAFDQVSFQQFLSDD